MAFAFAAGTYSCTRSEARYLDLSTGERIELEKDEETGLMVNAETGEPVKMYVDTEDNDTIWGKTGKVINGKIVRKEVKDDEWEYYYVLSDEYKMEFEKDGDYKVKIGDDQYKEKRTEDEYKIKIGEHYKKEVEKDGDITIKDGKKKIKIDGETGERKVKYDD
jgi:hypothetical protein